MDLKKTVQNISEAIGGKDNIETLEHCATRLIIVVKDESLVKIINLENIDTSKGYFYQNGQHQLIFGIDLVEDVFAVFNGDTPPKREKISTFKKISQVIFSNGKK